MSETSLSERPAKRVKISTQDLERENKVDLPAEVWALVCHYLPYHDVKQLGVVNKVFLFDVMKLITRVYIFHPSDLHVKHARRLVHVEHVYIYSLLKKPPQTQNNIPRQPFFPPDGWSLEYCKETKYRVVPYICKFKKIRFVFLGAMCYWQEHKRYVWDGSTNMASKNCKPVRISQGDRDSHSHRTLVHSFCGAFAAGSLDKRFLIDGLFHPRAPNLCPNLLPMFPPRRAQQCSRCNHVMKHFPSHWLIQARGSFLCVPAKVRLQRVMKRGHTKLLQDEKFVKRLIEDGIRDQKIVPGVIGMRETDNNIRAIGITSANLSEMKALVELELLDPKLVDPSIFYNRLKKLKMLNKNREIKFSKKDFETLVGMGFRLEVASLEKDAISLFEAPNRPPPRGGLGDLEGFLNQIGEQMGNDGGIEVNIEGGAEMEYANIFDRVRYVVREQLREDQAERQNQGNRPGEEGDAAHNQDQQGGQVNDEEQGNQHHRHILGGGIVMGGIIGHPHIAMGFGGAQLPFPFGRDAEAFAVPPVQREERNPDAG